jgi:hypothetical protein
MYPFKMEDFVMAKVVLSFSISQDGPRDKSLFPKSQKALNELKGKVREISKKVDNPRVKEVADFILGNAHVRILEQQGDMLFFKDFPFSNNGLPIAFFIGKIITFSSAINRSGIYAFYYRREYEDGDDEEDCLGNFIGLQDPKKSTLFFQAINLFHETKHALDHRVIPGYSRLSDEEREHPARFLEDIIISAYGGRELVKLAKEYAQKIKEKTKFPDCDERKIIAAIASQYERKLDHIFGKAVSKDEELFRMGRFVYDFAYDIYF